MYKTKAYSAASATSQLASTTIPRREATEGDVQIDILFCGICHSDLHYARDEWHDFMPTVYPCVPGHEIVGRVAKVGSAVTNFKAGDLVGVGCLVDSDHTCPNCRSGLEQFCPNMVLTYGSPDKHQTAPVTYGGYSDSIVVDERFVLRIPPNLDLAGARMDYKHDLESKNHERQAWSTPLLVVIDSRDVSTKHPSLVFVQVRERRPAFGQATCKARERGRRRERARFGEQKP